MPKAIIIYASRTGNTESFAKAIEEGLNSLSEVTVIRRKIGTPFSLRELETADALIFGSPAHYGNLSPDVKSFFQAIQDFCKTNKISLKRKVGAAFGTYGWDGGWSLEQKILNFMETVGLELFHPMLLSVEHPDETALEKARNLGRKIAEKIRSK